MKNLKKLTAYVGFALVLLSCSLTPAAFCDTAAAVAGRNAILEQAYLHKMAGDNYLSRGDYAQAISKYEQSLHLYPDSTSTYFNLAIAYYSERKIEKAAGALENLLKRDPSDVEAHYNLACLALYLRDIEKAKRHFKEGLLYRQFSPEFTPLIKKGLEFLQELHTTAPTEQDILFFLLRQGLSPLSLTASS